MKKTIKGGHKEETTIDADEDVNSINVNPEVNINIRIQDLNLHLPIETFSQILDDFVHPIKVKKKILEKSKK